MGIGRMTGSRQLFFLLALFGMASVLVNTLMPYFVHGGAPDWTVVTSANQFFKEIVAGIIGGLLALETRDGHAPPPVALAPTTEGPRHA